jgi:hypothetical protein
MALKPPENITVTARKKHSMTICSKQALWSYVTYRSDGSHFTPSPSPEESGCKRSFLLESNFSRAAHIKLFYSPRALDKINSYKTELNAMQSIGVNVTLKYLLWACQALLRT